MRGKMVITIRFGSFDLSGIFCKAGYGGRCF